MKRSKTFTAKSETLPAYLAGLTNFGELAASSTEHVEEMSSRLHVADLGVAPEK